jgi:stearoyl-CoA desaturase (Delta-9 desaturase)
MTERRVAAGPVGWPEGSLAHTALPASGILLAHLLPLTLLFTGATPGDWIACAALCLLICFAIGGGMHRYFAHRAFRTSRAFQFLLALLGSAFFGDAVGFAGKHRLHHRHADTDRDLHSPRQGLWHCWLGHLLRERCTEEEILRAARDWAAYPELMWLHRYFYLPGLAMIAAIYVIGGYSMVAAGYALSWCLMAVHAPAAINYFCHRGGSRRFETPDDSTNRPVLGVLLLGEGWHNNHHRHPGAARAGFRRWEVDGLYAMLKVLSWLGLVWDLREPPPLRPGPRRAQPT